MAFRKRQETTRPFDRMVRTTCGNCPTGCGLKIFVNNGKVVDIFGDEEHPVNKGSVCPKGLLARLHQDNPARLVTPRIREDTDRPWETVSWDEAVTFTAERLSRCLHERGKESVAIHGAETDPFDYLAGATLWARQAGAPLAPARFFPAAFGPQGSVARMFGVPASRMQGNTPRDWCNSRCIILYACDLAATDPIALGPVMDARDRGAMVLCVDSRNTVTAAKASFSVRVRPGSAPVFLCGVTRMLVQNARADDDFLSRAAEGFDFLKAALEWYTPEAVSRECGTTREALDRFAELVGAYRPVQVVAGDWFSRSSLGDADLRACASLAALTGSFGVPGGGLNLLCVSPFAPAQGPVGDKSLAGLLRAGGDAPSALVCHADPCLAGLDPGRALSEVPLVVNLAQYPNQVQKAAHVCIPVSCWLEYDGLLPVGNGRAVQRHKKVVEAPGQCRPPLAFWKDLAQAMGLPGAAAWGDGDDAAPFCDAALRDNPLTSAMTFADLDPETTTPGGVLWPCTDARGLTRETTRYISGTVRGENILFQRTASYPGARGRFPTASGRVVLSGAVPSWQESRANGAWPLMLVMGARVDRVPAWGGFVCDAESARVDVVRLNPRLAEALSVADGDPLVLENPRGDVCFTARLSDEVAPEVLWLPEGAGNAQQGCSTAMALFALSDPPDTPEPFARVMAYKAGADRDAALRAVVGLLKSDRDR